MSYTNPTGNGCTLEDCHTNVFALTDLTGIQWRRLSLDSLSFDVLDDPVLQSYSRCLQSDILSVWRRVLRSSDHAMGDGLHYAKDNSHYSKELWIFWYGKEPAAFRSVLSPELKVAAEGSWDQGLSYECRTLLFKAIHNLIERCLLSRAFIRLGKWFVQPSDNYPSLTSKSCHLSFCFNFFLHGENTVCASIEVKQHQPVVCLNNQHLNYALTSQSNVNVVLGPYGLNGTLTGHSYRDTDSESIKILSDWNQFYKFHEPSENSPDDMHDRLPALVEVIVCGVRMKYPSQFVLIADIDLTSPPNAFNHTSHDPSMGANGPADTSTARNTYIAPAPTTQGIVSGRITEMVSQDYCITTGTAKRPHDVTSDDKPRVFWDYHESSAKVSCACSSRHKSKTKGSGTSNKMSAVGKHGKDKNDKTEKQMTRRSAVSFHQRQTHSDIPFDMDIPVHRAPPTSSSSGPHSQQPQPTPTDAAVAGGATNPNSVSTPQPSAASIALTPGHSATDTHATTESPISDPSPLDDSQSMPTQPDPLMPTLSPQPSTVKDKDGVSNAKAPSQTEQEGVKTSVVFNGDSTVKPVVISSSSEESPTKPTSVDCPEQNANPVNSWLHSQKSFIHGSINSIRKPVLPFSAVESDDLLTASLYDFSGLNSWFDYAVKRAKVDISHKDTNVKVEPYSASISLTSVTSSIIRQYKQPPSPQPDPYEFVDDSSIEPGGLSRYRNSRDEFFPRQHILRMEEDMKLCRAGGDPFVYTDEKGQMNPLGSPPTPGGGSRQFISECQLRPNLTDLEHMFESSSSENEENPSSPNMTSLDEYDGLKNGSKKSNKLVNCGNVGSIGVAELTRMFPTPPSLENNNAHSPGVTTEVPMDMTIMNRSSEKYERIYTSDDPAKEVFKPPKIFQYPSSSKYAPVELPSSSLPSLPSPPHYKRTWPYSVPLSNKLFTQASNNSNYLNVPSVENVHSVSRYQSGIPESSPAMYSGSIHQQRTPMSYELTSPASNASSYMNKNLNSVDNYGTNNEIPEAHGLVVNIMLSDSVLNLFRDHNFDSCNVCVCNMSIHGSDVGLYLPDPTGVADTEIRCSCGYSAVMNRRLAHNTGLFYEDEVDITGILTDRFERRRPGLLNFEIASTKKKKVPTATLR